MKKLLETIALALVDDKDGVEVTEEKTGRETRLTLKVAPDDMGKVIGKGGRIAKAIRTVVKAGAIRADKRVSVEIAE